MDQPNAAEGRKSGQAISTGHRPRRRPIIAVVDGQGGGFGVAIIKELRASFGDAVEIWALGANSSATAAMIKAKANRGATGEKAIKLSLGKVNAVMGPIAITWANAMMGEVTPAIAEAIASAPIPRIVIPLFQEDVTLAGYAQNPLPFLILDAVRQLALITFLSKN